MSGLAVEQLHLSLYVWRGLGRRIEVVLTTLHHVLRVVFAVRGGVLALLMNVTVLIVGQHDAAGSCAALIVACGIRREQL